VDDLTVCSMTVANAGTTVSGSVDRVDGTLVVVVDGTRLSSARRLKQAIHELAQQLRRRLPRGRSPDWGVSVTCTSAGFTFGYGSLRGGGGGGSPVTFPPCVQRMISTYPQPQAGLAAALEHAERALADCCT
jgi:hypothetical protein